MGLEGKKPQMSRQLELPLAGRGEAPRGRAERGRADGDARRESARERAT